MSYKPTVPCWAAICCELDLLPVTTQEELDELLAENADDDTGCIQYKFWPTREAAMKVLKLDAL